MPITEKTRSIFLRARVALYPLLRCKALLLRYTQLAIIPANRARSAHYGTLFGVTMFPWERLTASHYLP